MMLCITDHIRIPCLAGQLQIVIRVQSIVLIVTLNSNRHQKCRQQHVFIYGKLFWEHMKEGCPPFNSKFAVKKKNYKPTQNL